MLEGHFAVFIKYLVFVLVIGCLPARTVAQIAEAQLPDWLQASGFARIVGGSLHLDEDNGATYLEYEDGKFSFDSQSLIGLQFDVTLSDTLGLSSQFIGHSAENRDSGIEWLYLSYHPSDSMTLKAGKLRIPLFNYSDVIDVGYAYPWITPPRQVYIDYLFSNYEGVNGQYTVGLDDITVTVEAYLGRFDDELVVNGERAKLEVDGLRGIIFTALHQNTKYRLAYHEGKVFPQNQSISDFRDVLFAAGYDANANSLQIEGDLFALQAGVSYQSLDYFFDSEFILVGSNTITIPDVRSLYVTAGYNFSNISLYSTFARSRFSSPERLNNIPLGRFAELDLLAQNYNQAFDTVLSNHDELDSITIGARWDYKINQALKLEVTRLMGSPNQRAFFSVAPTDIGHGNDAILTQVAFEWVF